jgi:hypothetical protein
MDSTGSQDSHPYPYNEGRLPMSEEELRTVEKNRRLMRRLAAPMMGLLGALGLAGGIWAFTTDTILVGSGIVSSSLIMLGFAWYYVSETRKPLDRPEKFFVTGVITGKRKIGNAFTTVYYELTLNGGKYRCFISEKDFDRLNPGDIVQCERLDENSVDADRVTVTGKVGK